MSAWKQSSWYLTVPSKTVMKMRKGKCMSEILTVNVHGVEFEIGYAVDVNGCLDHIETVFQLNDRDLWDVLSHDVRDRIQQAIIAGIEAHDNQDNEE